MWPNMAFLQWAQRAHCRPSCGGRGRPSAAVSLQLTLSPGLPGLSPVPCPTGHKSPLSVACGARCPAPSALVSAGRLWVASCLHPSLPGAGAVGQRASAGLGSQPLLWRPAASRCFWAAAAPGSRFGRSSAPCQAGARGLCARGITGWECGTVNGLWSPSDSGPSGHCPLTVTFLLRPPTQGELPHPSCFSLNPLPQRQSRMPRLCSPGTQVCLQGVLSQAWWPAPWRTVSNSGPSPSPRPPPLPWPLPGSLREAGLIPFPTSGHLVLGPTLLLLAAAPGSRLPTR